MLAVNGASRLVKRFKKKTSEVLEDPDDCLWLGKMSIPDLPVIYLSSQK
jgi:hypothetical protein